MAFVAAVVFLLGIITPAMGSPSNGEASTSAAIATPQPDSKLLWLKIAETVHYNAKSNERQVCNSIGVALGYHFRYAHSGWWFGTSSGKKARKAYKRASGKYKACNWLVDRRENGLTLAWSGYPNFVHLWVAYFKAVSMKETLKQLAAIYARQLCSAAIPKMTRWLLPVKRNGVRKTVLDQAIRASLNCL